MVFYRMKVAVGLIFSSAIHYIYMYILCILKVGDVIVYLPLPPNRDTLLKHIILSFQQVFRMLIPLQQVVAWIIKKIAS